MSFFDTQNPGIGGLKELTNAEQLFLTTLAGLSYNEGDILTIVSGQPAWSTSSGGLGDFFETVSKNLKSYDYTINYSGDNISTIEYTVPSGVIIKTFNYSGDNISSIVLSEQTPPSISLTKTLTYDINGNLESVSYTI